MYKIKRVSSYRSTGKSLSAVYWSAFDDGLERLRCYKDKARSERSGVAVTGMFLKTFLSLGNLAPR